MFVGYDDGSKSIKYYNAQTHKVLTSRNIHLLSPNNDEIPQETIGIIPDVPHEGESEESTPPTSEYKSESFRRKRDDEGELSQNKTRGKRIDYRSLAN